MPMRVEQLGGEYFAFEGSLGVLVATTFVVFEFLLVPLYEHAREGLSIAAVRHRLAQLKHVKISPEGSIPAALGLSDGAHGYSAFICVPRCLKVFFRFGLVVCVFAWEFELDTFGRAEMVAFQFNDLGPTGPKNQSSLMFPVPIVSAKFRFLSPGRRGRGNETYMTTTIPDINLDYAGHCLSRGENGRRVAFAAIYSRDNEGQRKIYCLNGTDYREKAEILSFNSNPADVMSSPVSSISLEKEVGPTDDFTNFVKFYSANVSLPASSELNGTHRGILRIWFEDNREISRVTGFVVHSTKGTVMRLCMNDSSVNRSTIDCPRKTTNATVTSNSKRCVMPANLNRVLFVEDIELRLYENSRLKYGRPLDVLLAWAGESWCDYCSDRRCFESNIVENASYAHNARFLADGSNFAELLWNQLRLNLFFFSAPSRTQLSLRVGTPKKHIRMKKWSTITLLAMVSLFVTYCVTSIVTRYRSRIYTGISSECITRNAIMDYAKHEARLRGQKLLEEPENSLTLGFGPADSGTNQRFGFVLSDYRQAA